MDRHVRIADQGRQVVDHVARGESFVAPMPRQSHMVNRFVFQPVGPNAARHQRLGADGAARRGDDHPVGVVHADLLGMFRRDLAEQFGLQFHEPRQPAAHAAAQVVLGQAIRREDVRVVRRGDLRVEIARYVPY